MPDIRGAIARRAFRREELLREFPELADDEIALADTLDGIDDLDIQIARLLRESRRSEGFAEAMKEIVSEDQARQREQRERAAKMKAIAMWAADKAGIKNVRTPDMTASLVTPRKGPVIITDEKAVPDRFCKIEKTPKKTEIGEALDQGERFDWAVRGNPAPYWLVRK